MKGVANLSCQDEVIGSVWQNYQAMMGYQRQLVIDENSAPVYVEMGSHQKQSLMAIY
ncbi:hypothetical protein GCM10011356_05260 [Kangiella profundi]|nr:hypothetical protein GCM10011356_05260 [Kangiella profundi]